MLGCRTSGFKARFMIFWAGLPGKKVSRKVKDNLRNVKKKYELNQKNQECGVRKNARMGFHESKVVRM